MSFRGLESKRVFEIPSDSNPDRTYMITQWSDNQSVTCTCPSFVRGRQQRGLDVLDRHCKHTDRVRESIDVGSEYTPYHPVIPATTQKPLTATDRFTAALQKQKDDKIREIELLDPRVKALIEQMAGK